MIVKQKANMFVIDSERASIIVSRGIIVLSGRQKNIVDIFLYSEPAYVYVYYFLLSNVTTYLPVVWHSKKGP